MELRKWIDRLKDAVAGKKLVSLAVLLGMGGILLIYLSTLGFSKEMDSGPERSTEEQAVEDCQKRLEEDLTRVVRAITGEEAPEVMITLKNNGRWVYAADSRQNGEETENTHVILEDAQGAQSGLRLADIQPEIKGVVIVSRSAADPMVRERLINAARTALGVSASRVCVVGSGG
ncbi:MAG: hypothetical protein HFE94_00800 [Acutalibacter sp.]|nr:hypothetical protein [Acutalibacter sp.]